MYDTWRANYGNSASGVETGISATAIVPEPATALLMLVVGMFAMFFCRRTAVS
jgi:hypothetical protein